MDATEKKVLGYLVQHYNSMETELCLGLKMKIQPIWAALQSLEKQGFIENMGYASHTQEWHVVDGKAVGLEDIAETYIRKVR